MIDSIITIIEQTIFVLVLLKIVLSYIMDPFHPFRQSIDRLIDPLLNPIRRILPTFGRFDFSPIVLIILVEVLAMVLRSIF